MALKGEVFKDIPGYECLYQVGNYGTVRSIRFRNNRTSFHRIKNMSLINNGNGYLYVSLTKNRKRRNHYVHRLVAEAFCEKKETDVEVNHLNKIKTDNRSENLEWCTHQENMEYSKGERKPRTNSKLPSSGYKYIRKRKNHYEISYEPLNLSKSYKTLEEAIRYRDEVIGAYYKERGWNEITF